MLDAGSAKCELIPAQKSDCDKNDDDYDADDVGEELNRFNVHDAKLICPKFCNLCLLVDGNWANWSGWSECDVTCGNGKHTRFRTCTNPAPAYQGLECEGEKTDAKTCQRQSCPVHGGWTVWSKWNACPVTCGLGMQKRYRNCSDPYPLRNGNHCFGDADEYRICFQQFCEGMFNQAEILYRHSTDPNFDLDPKIDPHVDPIISGYESSGLKLVTCNKNSGWTEIPSCNKVSCGNPVAPSNGKLAFISGVTFQAFAIFECCDTCRTSGNYVSTCLDDGTWSSSLKCIAPVSTCTKKPTYNETFKNVAFGKKVTLSSTYSSTYNAPKMVDGNFDRNNIAITQHQKDPFAVVDLEHSYTIHSIYIYNRKDYAYRLKNVIVQVEDKLSTFITVATHKTVIGVDCTFRFENPVRGRYLKIMLETNGEYLQITELEVYSDTKI
ncbi:A disintegrin and metalloproteinase with thrombospondin motifs 1-like [Ruditapes philippinarum]|uniref:A disintegrin and metalloproteinase with thrombospondin motifs 1-like n=1 Tax=Ruditapes philippinarum TaxID=129788 RepID=UPI00295B55BB|nr:A disintegrin and metalloproteinase with thrombospondin motifs 1-like [Ruditapes philippinarum]